MSFMKPLTRILLALGLVAGLLPLSAAAQAQTNLPSAKELAENAAEAARKAAQSSQDALDAARDRMRGNSTTIIVQNESADTSDQDVDVPLPRARPDETEQEAQSHSDAIPQPVDRPDALTTDGAEPPATPSQTDDDEEARVYQAACPAVLSGMIEAEILPPISEDNQCGLQSPYGVTGFNIDGKHIGLSQKATLNCAMATTLAHWAGRVSAYTQAVYTSPVSEIGMGTSYYCRPRNNEEGADISEHGFANAADITGFTLANGQEIALPENWPDASAPDSSSPDFAARTMWYAHDAACGYFTTVLGPEANKLHENHLHLDLGCHGQSCTARICE